MIIRSFYSGHPKKRTDLNKVWVPLGHTLKKVILLISSGMESLRKRVEPSRHLPETGLPRSRALEQKAELLLGLLRLLAQNYMITFSAEEASCFQGATPRLPTNMKAMRAQPIAKAAGKKYESIT